MDPATLSKLQNAGALLQRNDPAKALSICEGILSRDRNNAEVLHLRAMALGKLGRIDEARTAFEAAAKIHPQKDIILVNFGNALTGAGQFEEARQIYERAVEAARDPAPALNALGLACHRLGDSAAARTALERALTAKPDFAAARSNLGNVLLGAGDTDAAIAQFDQALILNPTMFSALINRGAALRAAGRIEEAVRDHRTAATRAPQFAESHYQLGSSLAMANEFTSATVSLSAALDIDPARLDVRKELVRVLWVTGRKADAFAMLDQAIEKTGNPDISVMRAELSYRDGDPQMAMLVSKRALDKATEHASAWSTLSKAQRALGDDDAALESARRAAKIDPKDVDIRHACAEIELASGHFEEALSRLSGTVPASHLQKQIGLRALAMRALGDPAYKALYDYERFTAQLTIDPPHGFETVEAFNAALLEAITPLHRTADAPVDQTLFGGTQSAGRLWHNQNPVIQAFAAAMLEAAARYVRGLPDDPEHPFLAEKTENLACVGAWSVMLSSGGGHVDHIHPAGWISASYYVAAPDEALTGDESGCLRLGASGVAGLDLPPEKWLPPIPGTVIFFPSYIWHGVEPFVSQSIRVTAPFDLAPARQGNS